MVDGRNLEERACDGGTGLCWNEGFRYRERHYDGSVRAWAGGSGRISRDLLIRPEDPRCQMKVTGTLEDIVHNGHSYGFFLQLLQSGFILFTRILFGAPSFCAS
jgi:hypothetical protein